MFSKEQRLKHLEKLAHSTMGDALKEHFEELIRNLTDGRNYSKENFEVEGKASIKAAAVLERIMRDLELLKREKSKVTRTKYT